MELRNYQKQIIQETRVSLSTHKRILAQLPCRAGKTVMFAYMAERHVHQNESNEVWFLVHRKELVDQAKSTFVKFGIPDNHILINMVQTVSRHIADYPKPTLIIFDEAHHSTAATWTRIIDAYPDVPVIGLTATPCRMDGKPLNSIYQDLILGVTPEWLIDNGYINPYKYYAPDIHLDEAQWEMKGSDYDMASVEKTIDKPEIYGDVVKYVQPDRKTIIYCPTVDFSQKLAAIIPNCVHVDGDLDKKTRTERIDGFRTGKYKALTNCNLVGEGLDVPECDTVVMLRPTKSTALYIQQAMRCMTKYPGKTAIVYDLVGNVYRHGMPTDDREWSLTQKVKMANRTGDKELLIRECRQCLRVYKGNARVCPYCGFDNGLTKAQIREHKEAELKEIKELKKKEQSSAHSFKDLVELGIKRGYKNPQGWAFHIMKNRGGI